MPIERYVYYFLLLAAFIVSVVKLKNDKGLNPICLLLAFSIQTELTSDYLRYILKTNRFAPYHFYIPIEYCLVTYYFSNLIQIEWVKKLLKISIPVYVTISILISVFINKINQLPSLQYNIDGTLIIIWSIITLFNLPFKPEESIFKAPYFWFCIAFMILFSGQFFMNGFFNSLSKTKPILAEKLGFIIYYCLNYLFYSFMILGLLCSKPTQRYITQ